MTDFNVPSPAQAHVVLSVDSSHPLFIVGRNGTGKSALANWLRQQNNSNTVYLPGSRTALFSGESLSLTPASRRQLSIDLGYWDSQADARWINHSGNNRNEKAIHDLTAAEQQYKNDLADVISNDTDPNRVSAAVSKLQARESPLDRVNQLLEQANIAVRMLLHDAELKATAGGNLFSYARMSDGERIALILIAEVIAAKPGAVFLIDEPELHLHRMIVTPLIGTLIKSRPDCEYIISTHELDLPTSVPNSRVCIVRSVAWQSDGQVDYWDFDVIDHADELPEALVNDIIGSRRHVLFTEGTSTSLDVPMYSVLFPKVSVIPKGSCKAVQQAVLGIHSTKSLHHTEAFGLVDNDGMSGQAITEFQAHNIYPLECFSVESLYYDPNVLAAIARRQASTLESDEQKQTILMNNLLDNVIALGIAEASKSGTPEHLAGRLAERRVRDSLLSQLPKRDELIGAKSQRIEICSESAYPPELARLQAMIGTKDLHGIIARYPVRHSSILGAVAKALKFQGRSDYETAAVARLAADESLRNSLLARLGPLSHAISV